jgi:uracil-DNA glycosylase
MECVVSDFVDWRNKARVLLHAGIAPDQVTFLCENASHDLFAQKSNENRTNEDDAQKSFPLMDMHPKSQNASPAISRDFMKQAHWVSHHSATGRWQFLYSLSWRLIHENKYLLSNPLDPEVRQFNQWMKAVTRDYHKMKAFVRFQSIKDFSGESHQHQPINVLEPETLHNKKLKNYEKKSKIEGAITEVSDSDEHFIAWFEPEHFVLALAADFFVKRFTSMSWSILTPYECAHWYQQRLIFTEGATRPPLPQDRTQTLWLQYYGSIFNPARVKIKAMQSEMPKKYWKNLPEAQLIKSLLQRATSRVECYCRAQVL